MTEIVVQRTAAGHRIGTSHPRAKLSEEMVHQIRTLRAEGKGYKKISRLTGVPVENVRRIANYQTWRHLSDGNTQGSGGAVAP